jgi:cellulose synthase/poly-beta-1,6-N-acetylglucosamine synthase-like glycosyltransferase
MSANAGAMGMGFNWAGSGQNLAYKKSYFNQIDGFRPVAYEISGDDIYLIQSISRIGGGTFNPDPCGAVTTLPVDSVRKFISQRIRWASNSSKQYQSQIWFLVFLLSVFIVNVSLLLHIVLGFFTLTFLCVWVLKILMEGIIIYLGSRMSKTPVSYTIFLLWSIIQIVYIPAMGLLGVAGKFSWKP